MKGEIDPFSINQEDTQRLHAGVAAWLGEMSTGKGPPDIGEDPAKLLKPTPSGSGGEYLVPEEDTYSVAA